MTSGKERVRRGTPAIVSKCCKVNRAPGVDVFPEEAHVVGWARTMSTERYAEGSATVSSDV